MPTASPHSNRPPCDALQSIMLIVFLLPVFVYIGYALRRLGCPFELEWMEGGSLQMMHRVLSGKELYGPPTVEFVPYTYTPLFFYVSALVSGIFGTGFLPLRAVSFAASLVSFVILFTIIRRETRSALGGAAAVGLFAASYAVNGNWFDIARIDSLCIALLLAGMWLGLGGQKIREFILGGVLVALSFFTKQAALIVAGPLFLAVILRHGKRGALFALSGLISIVVGVLYLDTIYDGWFLFYVLESPRTRWQSNLSITNLGKAVFLEFLPVFIISLGVSSPILWRFIRRPRIGLSLLVVIGGLFLAAAWGRVESINFLNSSIPAHLGMALLFGLAVGDYMRNSSRPLIPLVITVAFGLQLSIMAIFVETLIPDQKELSNYTAYTSFLTSLQKPIYLPDHGYVSSLGPDNSFAHSIGIMDLMTGGSPQRILPFRGDMEAALNSHRFGTIVCDTHLYPRWFQEALERNYMVISDLNPRGTWIPVLGFQNQPIVYMPRR